MAVEGVKLENDEIILWIERSFPIGSWCEDIEVTAKAPEVFSVDPGCPCWNFSWGYSAILDMCNEWATL